MRLFSKFPLTRASIKESFDNLPSGVCYADKNGIIILCNRQMHRLCHALLGTDLQHITELTDALKNPDSDIETVDYDNSIYRFPDGEVWQFAIFTITDEYGGIFTEVQAINITLLYEKESELRKENNALAEANRRAKKLYAEIDQIVRDEENFAIKTHVHDEVGTELGVTHNLLVQNNYTLDDFHAAGKRWERISATLGMTDTDSDKQCLSGITLDKLIATVAGIGVSVDIKGEMPDDNEAAYLLKVAIKECATNTVRHASGNKMTVVLRNMAKTVYASITNNGDKPDGQITEGGGLSSLRRRVETVGGTMEIETTPQFRLIIILPVKE